MAKLTAWLVTLVGIILLINVSGLYVIPYTDWLIALAVTAIGVGKLLRNYKLIKKGR